MASSWDTLELWPIEPIFLIARVPAFQPRGTADVIPTGELFLIVAPNGPFHPLLRAHRLFDNLTKLSKSNDTFWFGQVCGYKFAQWDLTL